MFRAVPLTTGRLAVTVVGSGPALLLAHGWPHSRHVWDLVLDRLATDHTVIAPDLPGVGDSDAPPSFDAATVAGCLDEACRALGLGEYAVIAIDAAVPAATWLTLAHPDRVRAAVLMESALPGLPGAEDFLAGGPPWWFGFHAAAGLAETVLVGHEAEYVTWFLDAGAPGGIDGELRGRLVDAHTGRDRLRHGFGYYRALPRTAQQLAVAARRGSRVPTLAIGSSPVGDTLARQLAPLCDDLVSAVLPDTGHIIPLDAPGALLDLVLPFLRDVEATRA
ncbi:Pimeloyl-ACP methyl ester carboxylesterase [Jatrophihabitans endophyticus]|uniref:Pimeloyl-ACP methyl ester carboxylesterase n=1 Tax=Jatrophihabitans endophyticus TaxID=1206085 RepID=A0A1M5SP83_9ACTN|nr:alpha/beta fold hydrolase [Jatrophihabitans endophyticus]SHH40321.1 Pimeloyl-ACP methyl ester carboxylesterase [Jatrophihabitans endophyticus]